MTVISQMADTRELVGGWVGGGRVCSGRGWAAGGRPTIKTQTTILCAQ